MGGLGTVGLWSPCAGGRPLLGPQALSLGGGPLPSPSPSCGLLLSGCGEDRGISGAAGRGGAWEGAGTGECAWSPEQSRPGGLPPAPRFQQQPNEKETNSVFRLSGAMGAN